MICNQALVQAKKMWTQIQKQHQQQQQQQKQQQKQNQIRNKIIEQCLHKRQTQQKKKQTQQKQNQQKQNQQTQKAIQSIHLLFVVKSPITTTIKTYRRLPPCVRIHGKPKPYAMRHPNLSVTRRKSTKSTT